MVEDYLSEREQAEALRNWWSENWRWIIGGLVLGFAVLIGYNYYKDYREQRALSAAKVYQDLEAALAKQDAEASGALLTTLTSNYEGSAYTQQGRLAVAKARVEAGKNDEAIALLRAVADGSKDEGLAQIARLRVARLLLQEGKHDEVLSLLDPEEAGSFAAQAREIRGDALFAKGNAEGARAEYAAALTADEEGGVDRGLVELKLQEVGGTPPEAKGAPPPGLQP